MTTQHEPTELKPCPFCGGELRKSTTGRRMFWHPGAVGDGNCLFDGQGIRFDQAEFWNTRAMQSASPAPSEDVVERAKALREALLAHTDNIPGPDQIDWCDVVREYHATIALPTPRALVEQDPDFQTIMAELADNPTSDETEGVANDPLGDEIIYLARRWVRAQNAALKDTQQSEGRE